MDALSAYTQGVQLGAVELGARGPAGSVPVQQTAGNVQRLMSGVTRQSIAAGGTANIPVTVSEPFRPERLVLSTAAQALDLTNLKIGTKSLNVSDEPISGNCFAEDAINTHVVGYTAQAGVGYTLSLANNTAGAITTGGGVFGLALN